MIYKRGRVYWYHFQWEGKRIQRSTKQGKPKVARDIESAYRSALAKGEVGIVERKKIPGLKAAMDSFLKWSKTEHREHPNTYLRHKYSSLALLRYFKDAQLDAITAARVEEFKAARLSEFKTVRGKHGQRNPTKEKISVATVNRELACLRAMFNHALKDGLPLTNPISKVGAKAFHEDNEQYRTLDYDEQEAYLSKATPTLRDVAGLMLETGMRPEEVYRAQPENVHLNENYLFNPYGKTKAAKRRIKLTATAKEILTRRVKSCKGAYLFPHDDDKNKPMPINNGAHKRALRDSKVAPFRLYDCRHTWATRAAESGIDLATLAAMLGHSKLAMVTRYVHPTQAHQTEAMEKMEQHVSLKKIEWAEKHAPAVSQAIQ